MNNNKRLDKITLIPISPQLKNKEADSGIESKLVSEAMGEAIEQKTGLDAVLDSVVPPGVELALVALHGIEIIEQIQSIPGVISVSIVPSLSPSLSAAEEEEKEEEY